MSRLSQIRGALTRRGQHDALDVTARLYVAAWSTVFFALGFVAMGVMTGEIR